MRLIKLANVIRRIDPEAWVWLMALLLLGCVRPSSETHFTLCFFKNLGITFCPGCGLGHSISYLLHGELRQSIYTHPLGIIAVPILLHRIIILFRYPFSTKQLLTR